MINIISRAGMLTFDIAKGGMVFTINCKCIKDSQRDIIIDEFKNISTDNYMAGGIFQELRDLLIQYPCMHKTKHETAPMFFAEWVGCIISKARLQGMQAVVDYTGGKIDNSGEEITQDKLKGIWELFIKQGEYNEMERPI